MGVIGTARGPEHRRGHRSNLRHPRRHHERVLVHALDERHRAGRQPDQRVILHPGRQAHRILQSDLLRPRARHRDKPDRALRGQRHHHKLDFRPRAAVRPPTGGGQRHDMGHPDGQPDPADLPAAGFQRGRRQEDQLRFHHQRACSGYILRQRVLHHP